MKILKILAVILLALTVGLISAYFYFKVSRAPQYAGELSMEGIDGLVEIFYTEFGVPHIYAESNEDAYFAFGYVHAQDRLWQMDLLRHVGSGRLSELFGSDLVETDRFLRTVGLGDYSKESTRLYLARNHESLPLVKAYLQGINAFIESNPETLEHTILGLEVEPFTEENIFQVLTYMAFSFQNAHITDPVLTQLSAKLDSSYLADLRIYHYVGETLIKNHDLRYAEATTAVASSLEKVNIPLFIGSNSWVLSGDKTESGSVILSNDPHIGFSQPSVWYEAHMVTPDIEYYGYHIAGSPFPPILHTPSFSNGLTMFENDDADFYVEEIHPEDSNLYRHEGEWKEIMSQKETIKVKGSEDVALVIRSTVHGPIVSDILGDEPLEDIVSMYWVTSSFENYTVESTYGFTQAQTLEDVEAAAKLIHGPGLNIMYGDANGNIAWWASGKLIERRNEQTSKTFYDGSTGLDDPNRFYPFEKNPHAINPPWGYTYSANNQPDSIDGVIYSGYYLPDDRGERITQLLEAQDKFSVDDVKAMLVDDQSKMFESIKGILLYAIKDTEETELLRALISWDATFNQNDFRPLVFQHWIYQVLNNTMVDEMGEDLWGTYKGTHTFKVAIEHLIKNADSKWWDDITTDEIESRTKIIQHSFEDALRFLKDTWGEDMRKWKWGDAHKLSHNHAMGTALSFLNVGPFSVSGGNEVINNMGYSYSSDEYQSVLFGPSTRRIVDFSDVRNNSWSILPTGQSGNYFSPHYSDQAEMFVNGEFRKMIMNEEEIKRVENKLMMHPH